MDVFCKIINKEIPSYTIYEDEIIKVILDVNPTNTGHCLIIPKKHYQDLFDIEDNVLTHINITSKKIAKLLIDKLNCEGLTLVENNGIVQEVKHYHLHLIPKYNKETKLTLEEVYNKIIN